MSKIPVIIDTDPGIDDLTAILLANSCEKFDIKAITAVSGNVEYQKVCKNALDIADFLNIDCRVGKGAARPLLVEPVFGHDIHGNSGLGTVVLPDAKREFDPKPAWDIIYEEAVAAEGKLVIFAIGPLTNIALALLKYPDLAGLIDHIYSMGGSAGAGNKMPYGEFNYVVDPHAAEILFKSGIDFTMVGLDACHYATCGVELFDRLSKADSKVARVLKDLSKHYLSLNSAIGDKQTFTLFDAITVAVAIDPTMLQAEYHNISCELKSPMTFGQSVVDFYDKTGKPNKCRVARTIDKQKYEAVMLNMAEYYETH